MKIENFGDYCELLKMYVKHAFYTKQINDYMADEWGACIACPYYVIHECGVYCKGRPNYRFENLDIFLGILERIAELNFEALETLRDSIYNIPKYLDTKENEFNRTKLQLKYLLQCVTHDFYDNDVHDFYDSFIAVFEEYRHWNKNFWICNPNYLYSFLEGHLEHFIDSYKDDIKNEIEDNKNDIAFRSEMLRKFKFKKWENLLDWLFLKK